jgi:hypothetical protein
MKAKLIIFFTIAVTYIPALFFFVECQYPPQRMMCLGGPIMGFYPWAIATGERGYSATTIYEWEMTLTLAFALFAGVAIYKNSTRLAVAFALLLLLSFFLVFFRMSLASYSGP